MHVRQILFQLNPTTLAPQSNFKSDNHAVPLTGLAFQGAAHPPYLEVTFHGGQEAHIVRGLHVELEQLCQDRLHIGREHGFGFLDHIQDLPNEGKLRLLVEGAQRGISFSPELNFSQRPIALGETGAHRQRLLLLWVDTCGHFYSAHVFHLLRAGWSVQGFWVEFSSGMVQSVDLRTLGNARQGACPSWWYPRARNYISLMQRKQPEGT